VGSEMCIRDSDEVREQTGWAVKARADVGETPPPTEAELTAIRRRQ